MSKKFALNALALALAGAIAMPAFAAGEVDQPGAAETYLFAKEVLGGTGNNPTADVEGQIDFVVSAPDILIGRTNGSGDITVILTFSGAEIDVAPLAAEINVPAASGTLNGGTITSGTNVVQFTITPPAAPGIAAGNLFELLVGALEFKKATGLSGTGITMDVVVKDTNTNITLLEVKGTNILSGVAATKVGSTSNAVAVDNTIDVLQPSFKTMFLNGSTTTKLGEVAVTLNDVDAVTAGVQVASTLGTGAVTNDNAGNFQFAAGVDIQDDTADTVVLTLTVPNDGAFLEDEAFFVKPNAVACGAFNGATDVAFEKVAGKYTATVGVPVAAGMTYTICATADGDTAIAAQTIGLQAQIDLAGALTVDPAPYNDADFAVWSYNGTVLEFQNVNPAANAAAQSFLRFTNNSSIACAVTLEGQDDAGETGTADISFTLDAAHSITINSEDLEGGNAGKGLTGAFGDGAGRWYVTATAECDQFVGSALNRNTTDGTVTNLTPDKR